MLNKLEQKSLQKRYPTLIRITDSNGFLLIKNIKKIEKRFQFDGRNISDDTPL